MSNPNVKALNVNERGNDDDPADNERGPWDRE